MSEPQKEINLNGYTYVLKDLVQEAYLLEEAKQRYPKGTKFKNMSLLDTCEYIINGDNFYYLKDGYSISEYNSNGIVYCDGVWAEIVEDKKYLFEFEGYKYYEGDYFYYFNKDTFIKIDGNTNDEDLEPFWKEGLNTSKILPTEKLRDESLIDYIWNNYSPPLYKSRDLIDQYREGMKDFDPEHEKRWICEQIIEIANGKNK